MARKYSRRPSTHHHVFKTQQFCILHAGISVPGICFLCVKDGRIFMYKHARGGKSIKITKRHVSSSAAQWKAGSMFHHRGQERERAIFQTKHSGKRNLCFITVQTRGLSFNKQREARSMFYHSLGERAIFQQTAGSEAFHHNVKARPMFQFCGQTGPFIIMNTRVAEAPLSHTDSDIFDF